MDKEKETQFGVFDSETRGWTYTIPEGFEAKIEGGKVVVQETEKSRDEKIRKTIIELVKANYPDDLVDKCLYLDWLERQKNI